MGSRRRFLSLLLRRHNLLCLADRWLSENGLGFLIFSSDRALPLLPIHLNGAAMLVGLCL